MLCEPFSPPIQRRSQHFDWVRGVMQLAAVLDVAVEVGASQSCCSSRDGGRHGHHHTPQPAAGGTRTSRECKLAQMSDGVVYSWRDAVTDDEIVELVNPRGGRSEALVGPDPTAQSRWMTARNRDGVLVGFVNIAWDGGDHAFLLTPRRAAVATSWRWCRAGCPDPQDAKAAGCEWLHVDFEPDLRPFYFGACGFRPTDAGLIHLYSLETEGPAWGTSIAPLAVRPRAPTRLACDTVRGGGSRTGSR
jgi:hypothetical protein